jgi:pyruvate ferredoxin oxidoreductase gamma subunit
MYRIRLHGRGGQGIKTAGRILGTAFFLAGFEVQDAPRYGAERRGAPIFAYVRADRQPIRERGVIRRPDLVVVADDTLVASPAAGVLTGLAADTVLLLGPGIPAHVWRERLQVSGRILNLPRLPSREDRQAGKLMGVAGVGAAARLVGVISREALAEAAARELAGLGSAVVEATVAAATAAFDLLAEHAGCVREAPDPPATAWEAPAWIDLPLEEAAGAAPAIFTPATSELVPTGQWRTVRPVIDYERCRRCAWICSTLCPDGVISLNEAGFPVIDYRHCKGCLICMSSCPSHAIRAVPEEAVAGEAGGG